MFEPTKKSAPIEALLNKTAGRNDAIANAKCVRPPIGCGQPIGKFTDDISRREYTISGLCQECQDKIFS